jgi:hypothetical protein
LPPPPPPVTCELAAEYLFAVFDHVAAVRYTCVRNTRTATAEITLP